MAAQAASPTITRAHEELARPAHLVTEHRVIVVHHVVQMAEQLKG